MKYVVSGYCLVPMQAQVTVEANSVEQALAEARKRWDDSPRSLILAGTVDESAAFDWQPTAEPDFEAWKADLTTAAVKSGMPASTLDEHWLWFKAKFEDGCSVEDVVQLIKSWA